MPELEEKQFNLGGVSFGSDCPVGIKDWTPGSPDLRNQDSENPTGDGIRPGKTFRSGATWSFSLFTNVDTEEEAWRVLAELAAAWDNDEARMTSGVVVPLYYRLADRDRVVYGQPRRWTATPTATSLSGRIDIEADFLVMDSNIYDAEEQNETIPIAPPLELDAGLEVPFIPPFDAAAGASVRESSLTIGGTVGTPIWVTFNGPVAGASVVIGGRVVALVDPVAEDNPVTVDARPWVASATYGNGGGARVSPRVTRISKLLLPPGQHEIVFTGEDQTGTASVLVSWRNANRTPR